MLTAQYASPTLSRWMGYPQLDLLPNVTQIRKIFRETDQDISADRQACIKNACALQSLAKRATRDERLMLMPDKFCCVDVIERVYKMKADNSTAWKQIRAWERDGTVKRIKKVGTNQYFVKVK